MVRNTLPQRRASESLVISGDNGHKRATLTVGYYPNGRVGEVFISAEKVGSDLEATARDCAVLISIAIQYGIPIEVMKHSITRDKDNHPTTIVGEVLDKLSELNL